MPLRPFWAFERGTLWTMDLDGPSPMATAVPAGVMFGEAQPEDTRELAAAMGVPDPQEVVQRFLSGRRCFVARVEGAIAAYGWVSEGAESIGELERTLRIQPSEAYIWDCATLPAFRRRGLYSALLRCIVGVLRGEGVRRLWIGASLDNAPSIRGFRSAGFRPVIKLIYLRVLGLRGNWLMGDTTAPRALVAEARRALSDSTSGRQASVAARASHADASDIH